MSTVIKDLGAVSAYAYAVEKGYTGTEAEFAELMADYAAVGQRAEDAAENALNSKTAAQTAATTATNKASEATTAAQTATTKAGEAQTSAQTASSKASEASQSASQASGCAQTAETAKTDAQTAKTQADTARDEAVTAKTAAETAQGAAEDAAESVSASAAQIATNAAEISELKNDGVAPSAEQLLSKNTAADSVPYLFRQTGGDGADREYLDAIVGGTVAWNQIDPIPASSVSATADGITFTDNRDGSYTFYTDTNGATADHDFIILGMSNAVIRGHVYAITGAPAGQSLTTYLITDKFNGVLNYERKQANICKPAINGQSATARLDVRLTVKSGCVVTTPITFYLNSFDLTTMFGTEIADYIYSLEQATAGAGVALFRQMFPNDYYSYNAGELLSVSGLSEHKTVGFNQWDEEWEVGGYAGATGNPWETNTRIRSKTTNYISVFPGTNYYAYMPSVMGMYLDIMFYDADKAFVSSTSATANNRTFTTPNNARFMRFASCAAYGTTYNNDICINLSDPTKNGTYEPYKAHSYPLDSTLTLRGIPKLSDGKMYYDGDRYLPDGTVERRYGIVDLGTLDWRVNNAGTRFVANLVSAVKFPELNYADQNAVSNLITAKYMTVGGRDGYDATYDKAISGSFWNGSNYLQVNDSAYTDATTFKAAMSGVYLVYELATPTTEEAGPYLHLQQCGPNGTEKFVSTGIIPVGHETRYPENLRAKIEGLPWDFSSLIAPTEKTTTASRNYTTGNLLIMGNTLYKVTANIANGGTITPNTNVTATTLSEILSALAQ